MAVLFVALLSAALLRPITLAPAGAACNVRAGSITMKGKPSRGMPKKAVMNPGDIVSLV